MNTLSMEVGWGSQSLHYKEVLDIDGKKVRILIRSNIGSSSYARAELFNGNEWTEVDYIHQSRMKTSDALYHRTGRDGDLNSFAPEFKEDRDLLVAQACDILF